MRKFMSITLSLLLLIAAFPFSALRSTAAVINPTISVDTVTAEAGNTVTVPIKIENNPGILGATITVSYDAGLTLTKGTKGDAFSVLTMTKPGSYTSPCNFVWDGLDLEDSDIKDGTLLTLTFMVSETVKAGDQLAIHISYLKNNIIDKNFSPVEVEMIDGGVTIEGTEPEAVLSGISVKTEPTKVAYSEGDALDTTGLVLTASYSDGSRSDITEGFTVTGYDAKTIGKQTLTVTYQGQTTTFDVTVTSNSELAFSLTGEQSQPIVSGKSCAIPLYVNQTGELHAFYAKIAIPSEDFKSVSVSLSNIVSKTGAVITKNYSNGILSISIIGVNDFNPGTEPLVNISLTPNSVLKETTTTIQITHFEINNGDEITTGLPSLQISISPNYMMQITVHYFKNNKVISGVAIHAGNVQGVTDDTGAVSLEGINTANLVVSASKDTYIYDDVIEANDAVLILKSRVNLIALDSNQIIAADVDGNGKVNEWDAYLILRFAVGLDMTFSAGSWKFVPAKQEVELTTDQIGSTFFTAILVGDVDGSLGEEQ